MYKCVVIISTTDLNASKNIKQIMTGSFYVWH